MANPTGTELFNLLDQRTRDVSTALDELNAVIAGDAFAPTLVWPTGEIADVPGHPAKVMTDVTALQVVDGLESALDTLFDGVPGGSINDAISAATGAVQSALEKMAELNEELGVQDRVDAFNELNNPATPNRETADYGYIPAIEGVINAVADTSIDADDALDPLRAIGAAIAAGGAYAIFAAYATATIEQLNKSLRIGESR